MVNRSVEKGHARGMIKSMGIFPVYARVKDVWEYTFYATLANDYRIRLDFEVMPDVYDEGYLAVATNLIDQIKGDPCYPDPALGKTWEDVIYFSDEELAWIAGWLSGWASTLTTTAD